jgi:hypothetical protein
MNSKIITLAGAVLLIVGLFLPVASVFGVSVNLMSPPEGGVSIDAIVLIACGVLGGLLALVNQAKWAVIPGIGALGLIAFDYFRLSNGLSGASGELSAEQAQMVSQLASINYLGWGVMGVGALVLLVGGAMGWKKSAPPAA